MNPNTQSDYGNDKGGNKMIVVIDYGTNNLHSVRTTLRFLGVEHSVARTPDALQGAKKIILPGVGAFGAGMQALRDAGFETPLHDAAAAGTPILGICLGMQFLFEESEEFGSFKGLGLLKGNVVKFPTGGPKVPHMGWNKFIIQRENPLLAGLPEDSYAYFVHSFYVKPTNLEDIVALTDYAVPFTSVVNRGNIFGIQPHPEKSQNVGKRILYNFAKMMPEDIPTVPAEQTA